MKSDKFIDPKSDYAFKVIFGTVSNKELTIGFLNSLLNKDITFHNVEMQGNNADGRRAIFDLFCEGSDGELFVYMWFVSWTSFSMRAIPTNTFGILYGWTAS